VRRSFPFWMRCSWRGGRDVKSITGAKKKAPVLFVETYSVFLAAHSGDVGHL